MEWHDLLAGYGGPILATIFGIAGVGLGRFIAQGIKKDGEEKLSTKVNLALIILFSLAVIGYVRGHPDVDPLRLLGYGSAAGFIGLPVLEYFAENLMERFKGALDGFMNAGRKDDDDHDAGITRAVEKLNDIPRIGDDSGTSQ